MFKKSVLIFLTAAIFLLSLTAVSAEDSTQNFTDIQTQIDESTPDDTITISGNYEGSGEIFIDKNLNIQGKDNATLDAGRKSRIIAAEGNLKFDNITFKNGVVRGENSGGAVFILGNATFANCIFRDNYGHDGGAVYSMGNMLFINCTFINNRASDGGAIFHSTYNNGNGDYGKLTLINCSFERNSASENAGAVFSIMMFDEGYGDTIIENSMFINNSAPQVGAVFAYSNLNVSKSQFIENKALGLKKGFVTADDYGYAAAIEDVCGKVEIKNTTFVKNQAKYGTIRLTLCEVDFENNTYTNNSDETIYLGECKSKYPKFCVLTDNLTQVKPFRLTATSKLTTTYSSGKTIKIKVTYNGKPAAKFGVYILDAKAKRGYALETNTNGEIIFKASALSYGTHKLQIELNEMWYSPDKTTCTVKVNKAKTTVKAPKVTNKYKKSKYFKITVKAYKKPVKNLKLKVKVYTGKKYRTYTLKTNKNGLAKLNTKKLKKGSHKVIISSGNANYKVSAKSLIKIKR